MTNQIPHFIDGKLFIIDGESMQVQGQRLSSGIMPHSSANSWA